MSVYYSYILIVFHKFYSMFFAEASGVPVVWLQEQLFLQTMRYKMCQTPLWLYFCYDITLLINSSDFYSICSGEHPYPEWQPYAALCLFSAFKIKCRTYLPNRLFRIHKSVYPRFLLDWNEHQTLWNATAVHNISLWTWVVCCTHSRRRRVIAAVTD